MLLRCKYIILDVGRWPSLTEGTEKKKKKRKRNAEREYAFQRAGTMSGQSRTFSIENNACYLRATVHGIKRKSREGY